MRLLLAVVLAAAASSARAADEKEAAASARAAFLEGRYDDAEASWRYLAELGASASQPELNLALTLRDKGDHEAAAAQWLKASLLEGADGFVWNQRGWANLALGRRKEARESFAKAIDHSSTTTTQAEANVGLALSFILDGKPKAAADPLKRAGLAGPYAISVSAQLTAEAALAQGDRQTALTYLRQAVEVDPMNDEALRRVARELAASGDNRAAWRLYKRVLSGDPKNPDARKEFERLGRFITGDADAASGVRRIARPVLDPTVSDPPLSISSRTIRVGLYGAPDGRPAVMTRAYIVLNSPFKVSSAANGSLRDNGRANDQWEVDFRSESGLVEVRDASRNILFTAKQPFTFIPDSPRGTALLKSAAITDPVGVDRGDREVRAAVEVIPNPWGFRLVEVVPVEHYLYGVVSLVMPEGSPPQALRAQAVVARTAALWAQEDRQETLERFDLLDDDSVQRTIGVSGELRAAAEAVRDTEGIILALGGRPAQVPQHEDSGGTTEDGKDSGEAGLTHLLPIADGDRALEPWRSAGELERFAHEAPPDGLFSEAAAQAAPSAARWMRVIDGKELRLRVERRKDLGALRRLRVAARSGTGRVKAVEVIGSDGSGLYAGRAQLEELFGPGGLRSTLFTLQPIMDGRRVERVVLWGAGTGSGLGFPRDGALGQASLGRSWKEIVKHYFPTLELKDVLHPPKPAAAKPAGAGPYKRTLNFRSQKTRTPRKE